jgi:hypothetical protein
MKGVKECGRLQTAVAAGILGPGVRESAVDVSLCDAPLRRRHGERRAAPLPQPASERRFASASVCLMGRLHDTHAPPIPCYANILAAYNAAQKHTNLLITRLLGHWNELFPLIRPETARSE